MPTGDIIIDFLQIAFFKLKVFFAHLYDVKHFHVTFLGHKASMNVIAVTYGQAVEESLGCVLLPFSLYGDWRYCLQLRLWHPIAMWQPWFLAMGYAEWRRGNPLLYKTTEV